MTRRLLRSVCLLAAAPLLLTACSAATTSRAGAPADPAIVATADGAVHGTVADTGHRRFQGIPFAAPPVGELRWRAPAPSLPWHGVRDATGPVPFCPQSYEREADGSPRIAGTEDCLYLNVDTPPAAAEPRPVMVFLHGGGFTGGQGAPYDPSRVTDGGDVVVVTANYRLGALGFLAHPALDDPFTGGFGLADQQAALRWVQRNIAAFGGDPGNVTLWGESAGAYSVCAQLAAPGARGLFHKAVVQSGPCGNRMLPREAAEQRGLTTAERAGCADPATAAACLRDLPLAALVGIGEDRVGHAVHRHIAELPWFPVVGTPALPADPVDAITTGTAADVPLVHGGTAEEMQLFVAGAHDLAGRPLTAEQYPQVVARLFGAEHAPAILERYPLAEHPSPGAALSTLLSDQGDMLGACSRLPVDRSTARRSPVFAYDFAEPGDRQLGGLPPGAHHGADVPYLFDSLFPGAQRPQRTPAQHGLADRLVRYWTTFAHTGRPAPEWPPASGGTLRITAAGTEVIDLAAAHRCDFWSTLGSS